MIYERKEPLFRLIVTKHASASKLTLVAVSYLGRSLLLPYAIAYTFLFFQESIHAWAKLTLSSQVLLALALLT